mmetsp:Transcript_4186/g.7984  ORF Transcript_4186/g.7984 Transcript_4186/m.7984 type:complete len:209 (-) Transcript_4186:108-734(-)
MGKSGAVVVSIVLAAGAAYAVVRNMQKPRYSSWSCACGKVKGIVKVREMDYTSTKCFCKSCRNVDVWCALYKGFKGSVSDEDGGICLLQMCKSDILLKRGDEYIKCAKYKEDAVLARFYASCCGAPLMNSIRNSGFVGLLAKNLEDRGAAFGPYAYVNQEEAPIPVEITKDTPLLNIPAFFFNMIRFMPWINSAPFLDFTQPVELITL